MKSSTPFDDIAEEFSKTRQTPWPEFSFFAKSIRNGSSVLDLGCGNGRFYRYLLSINKHVAYTGLDLSEKMLEIARKQCPGAEFVKQNMSVFSLPEQYDVIVSIAAFHHLLNHRDREQTCKRIKRHLKPDGVLFISVWNLWQMKYLFHHIRAWGWWIASGFRKNPKNLVIPFGKNRVPRQYHAFLSYELKQLLRSSGFVIEEWKATGHNYCVVASLRNRIPLRETVLAEGRAIVSALSESSPAPTS